MNEPQEEPRKSVEDAIKEILDENYRFNIEGKARYRNWKDNGWFWTLEDYESSGFSHEYIKKLFRLRVEKINKVLTAIAAKGPTLTKILHLLYNGAGEQNSRPLRVVDIAGGPGCAAFGVGAFLATHKLPFSALVLDPASVWEPACEALHFKFEKAENLASMAARCVDADIVVISHAHVDFAEKSPGYLETLIDSVAARRATVGTLVVWLDRYSNVNTSAPIKGTKNPKRSLTWVFQCSFPTLKGKQDRAETCLVGWISGPGRKKSECHPPPEYLKCPYMPVMFVDVNDTFHVAKSALQGAKVKFHKNFECPPLNRAKGKVSMPAAEVQQRGLEACQICARDIGKLVVEYCGEHSADSWKTIARKIEKSQKIEGRAKIEDAGRGVNKNKKVTKKGSD